MNQKVLYRSQIFLASVLFVTLTTFIISCGARQGTFNYAALGLGKDRVIVAQNAASSKTITMYDDGGNYLGMLADYTSTTYGPQGIARLGNYEVVAPIQTDNRVDRIRIFSQYSTFINTSSWYTTATTVAQHPATGELFLLDGVTVEKTDGYGNRNSQTPYYSNTGTNCTLVGANQISVGSNSYIYITGTGRIVSFPTGSPSNTGALNNCASFAALANANGVVYNEADGNVYVTTGAGNSVYRYTASLGGATSIFSNASYTPTVITAMSDGTLLFFSTSSIERITNTTPSSLVGTKSFIKNAFTNSVTGITVVKGR